MSSASGDSPTGRTWTLMLSVQVYMHGQSINLGKKAEDFEAEISLLRVPKASWYTHMRESNIEGITWEIRWACLLGNHNIWENTPKSRP